MNPASQPPSRILRRCVLAAVLLATCVAVVGCRPSVAARDVADADLPEVRKAIEFEREGQYDKAIDQYKVALLVHPTAALAHLNLGLLLHDSNKDYIGAIYHYRRYLDMSPSTQKKRMIDDRLRLARQLLAAEMARDLAQAGDAGIYIRQLQAERQRSASLEKEKNALEEELGQAKKALQLKETEVLRLRRRVEVLSAPPASAEIAVDGQERIRSATQVSADPEVRTYIVKQGDSLSRIAEKVYGDAKLWSRIKNANLDVVKDDRVQVGTELIIP
ncbi:MAG: LysM peptidoglycan-binding domain-containing protein [Kiritimatiellia bacterium]|jgi:nucleoid-associated protein YgaU